MARPKNFRRVAGPPDCTLFKPAGVSAGTLEQLLLTIDELEAIRLADQEGLYQEAAARHMNVSRPTFGRILESARHKVATVLIEGKALRIEGGEITMSEKRTFHCSECKHGWELPCGPGRPSECPECKSDNIHRATEEGGQCDGRHGQQRRKCSNGPRSADERGHQRHCGCCHANAR